LGRLLPLFADSNHPTDVSRSRAQTLLLKTTNPLTVDTVCFEQPFIRFLQARRAGFGRVQADLLAGALKQVPDTGQYRYRHIGGTQLAFCLFDFFQTARCMYHVRADQGAEEFAKATGTLP
jgi:hypothetical protein